MVKVASAAAVRNVFFLSNVQADLQAAGKRLAALEGSMSAQLPECLALSRRLTARQADAEARSNMVTTKVSMVQHVHQEYS